MIRYITTVDCNSTTWEEISLPDISEKGYIVQSGIGFYYILINKSEKFEFKSKDRGFFNPGNVFLIFPKHQRLFVNCLTQKIKFSIGATNDQA